MTLNTKSFFKTFTFVIFGMFIATFIFVLVTHPGFKKTIEYFYSKSDETLKEFFVTPHKEWFHNYSDIAASDKYYPIVHLRSGHKIIKGLGEELLVGWQYELINTSKKNYLVEITYQILDDDDFLVGESKKTKFIYGESIDKISDTFNVSYVNEDRLTNNSWFVGLTPEYDPKHVKNKRLDRFDKACKILKAKESQLSLWIKRYAKYCFCSNERFNRIKEENTKWYRIATTFDTVPDNELFTLRESYHTHLNYEPSDKLKSQEEYKNLTASQQGKIHYWLFLEGEFNQYYDFLRGGLIFE